MSEPKYSNKIYDEKKKEKLLDDVLKLTLDGNSPSEIAKIIGKESEVVIYNYQNQLVEKGKLEKHNSGRLKIYEVIAGKDYMPISKKAFSKIPIIADYIKKKSLTDKESQLKQLNSHVTRLTVFCNTVLIHPNEVNFVKDVTEFLSEKMIMFRNKMNEGNVNYLRPNNVRIRKNSKDVSHQPYARAWASLLDSIGKPLPELPLSHILNRSRRVIGAYSSIALTYKQFKQGIEFFNNFELKYKALFILMVTIFPRTNAVFTNPINIQLKNTVVDGKSYPYGIIEKWYETKQEHFFSKIIVDAQMIRIIQSIIPNGEPIIKENVPKEKRKFNELLRKFYVSLGLLPEGVLLPMNDPNRPVFNKNTDQYYLDLDPTYALRHTGAIIACQFCNYQTNYVSKLGWKNNETLEKYYATIPIEQLVDDVKCNYCNPSIVGNSENLYFCRFAHAIAYFARGHLPKEGLETKSI